MCRKGVEVALPGPTVALQPLAHFHERLSAEFVEPPLGVSGGLDQASVPQHPQVLGYLRLGKHEESLDLPDIPRTELQQLDDSESRRLGEGGKGYLARPGSVETAGSGS